MCVCVWGGRQDLNQARIVGPDGFADAQTWVQQRKAPQGQDVGSEMPAFESKGNAFGVFHCRQAGHTPNFRAVDWSPLRPRCHGMAQSCLLVTCSTDNYLAVHAHADGGLRGKSWEEVACLSGLLLDALEVQRFAPRQVSFDGGVGGRGGGSVGPGRAVEDFLERKKMLSLLTVAWSKRTSAGASREAAGIADEAGRWSLIAAAGHRTVSLFLHGRHAKGLARPKDGFECAAVVGLPHTSGPATAVSWLDDGPGFLSSGPAVDDLPVYHSPLVTGHGDGSVCIWAVEVLPKPPSATDVNKFPACELQPQIIVCSADNSPVLSLCPAPWHSCDSRVAPGRQTDLWQPRLAVAKGQRWLAHAHAPTGRPPRPKLCRPCAVTVA